jgi:hypothetical protein
LKQAETASSKGIPIQCPHKDCGYKWSYGGRFFIYATCPSCRRNLKYNTTAIYHGWRPELDCSSGKYIDTGRSRRITMDDSSNSNNKASYAATVNYKNPLKKVHCVANKLFVVIDDSIAKHLEINDNDTWFEQIKTDDGILLRKHSRHV